MDRWNVTKYDKMLKNDEKKAYKSVYTHNKSLIKSKIIPIPETLTIDVKKFTQDLKDGKISNHDKTNVAFMLNTVDFVASNILQNGYNVTILNICDSIDPGSMYTNGYEANEEQLCRAIPALYESLKNTTPYSYPLSEDTILYTKDSLLFRDSKRSYIRYKEPKNVSVINVPNTLFRICHKQKLYNLLEMMFFIPRLYDPNKNAIILTAYGMTINNDSKIIASLFHRLIQKYKKIYKLICFAIPYEDLYETYRNSFKKS